ncbi:MAG: exodeoxyribonuclease III [Hyphomonas sp.]|jgi:exodeoxyribonuclease-3|uniref:Exodeoxyribonuclease III n=4 Tax=root TaxID=1 RepID=A0A160TY63_9ZZZZ|nr:MULTISPECIES: exodeoxyribonuclease III [unclassified Hyphomonas]MAA83734.1 exodeoxyribonuclease III [Hyphomonas sp.]MAN91770.1 exodeoxyribonuclease III [Hyphomonadaceae bacterium]MBG67180.1 exodeoxyribonuclease III [Hyphomonas sp.]HCN92431.1 exodeoxyribonuclease III [Hyphomonas sp.]|tara:strand:- start:12420 stop:13196 length:777 start_codon:yes stop_codon:yes gene_type:complete
MRIATWNVNSIKARLPTVLEVLDAINCDVVCLQEIKCETDAFPYMELEERGWNCAVLGQKSYNGVALLSKHEIEDVTKGLPTIEDEQARYIEALILSDTPIRVGGLYLPNGNPAPGPKYDYKMEWMDALERHARELLKLDEAFVLCGDYNCIPTPADCWDETVWQDDALALPQTRAEFRKLKYLGLADSFELTDNRAHQYTFWDYQGGAFKKDHGIRIDHLLCSPQACDRLQSVEIYRKARELEKPSDHVPVIGVFED